MVNVRRISAWIPTLLGVALLAAGARSGALAWALAVIPATLLVGGGLRCLIAPDLRGPQLTAVGAVLGILLAGPIGWTAGAAMGLSAFSASLASFVAAGWTAIVIEPPVEEVPERQPTLGYAAKVALDDILLGAMSFAQVPTEQSLREGAREVVEAHRVFAQRGWIEKPESFHVAPPPLSAPEFSSARAQGVAYEHMRFESGYDPEPAIPGCARWRGYERNRTAHTYVLRGSDSQAPWLVCIHGFGMGKPMQDIQAFRAGWLREKLGLNVVLYVLPVHGPRAPGRRSGSEFMSSTLNFVHAESQAIWDLRRLLGWVRAQGARRIGTYGISLGGYTAALLAGLEDGIHCAIECIPPSDLVVTTERFSSYLDRLNAASLGIDWERERAVRRVVSPLAVTPHLEQEGRSFIAATGDRLVPPAQVRDLWRHWGRPPILWSSGGHFSVLFERDARARVETSLRKSLLEPTA